MKEIEYVFPSMTSAEYMDSINLFNLEIDQDNMRTMIPRLIVFSSDAIILTIYSIFMWTILLQLISFITAKHLAIIFLSLLSYIIIWFIGICKMPNLFRALRPHILSLLKSKDYIESYSFSEYVERKDSQKKAIDELNFYRMCDILRQSSITDTSCVCDGNLCKTEIAYKTASNEGIFTFLLNYHESPHVSHITINLESHCVVFPQEV